MPRRFRKRTRGRGAAATIKPSGREWSGITEIRASFVKSHELGFLRSVGNVEILELLRVNGEMMQIDLRHSMTHCSDMIKYNLKDMEDLGLLRRDRRDSSITKRPANFWSLTDKGEAVAMLLRGAILVVTGELDLEDEAVGEALTVVSTKSL